MVESNKYDEPNIESLKYAEGVARDIITKQIESIDTLVTGASILIGFSGVLIGILLTGELPEKYSFAFWALVVALICILDSLIFALLAAKSTIYNYLFNPRKLWELTVYSEITILTRVYERMVVDIETNTKILAKKWEMMLISMAFLFVGIFSMVIYIIVSIMG